MKISRCEHNMVVSAWIWSYKNTSFVKHFIKVISNSSFKGTRSLIMFINYKYVRSVVCRTDKCSVWCFAESHHGVDMMWQPLHKISGDLGECLQIVGSCVRSPTRRTSLLQNAFGNLLLAVCLSRFSTVHSTQLVIIDILFMIMTSIICNFSSIIDGFYNEDK